MSASMSFGEPIVGGWALQMRLDAGEGRRKRQERGGRMKE